MNFTSTRWSFVASLALTLVACGGRTQQEVGGKTSWLSTCSRDADCGFLEGAICVQQLCTVGCEEHSCGSIDGTRCVEGVVSCTDTAACLPECEDNSDCRRFGSDYECRDLVCIADACQAETSSSQTTDASSPAAPSPQSTDVITPAQPGPPSPLPGTPTDQGQAPTPQPSQGPAPAMSGVVTDGEDSSEPPLICSAAFDGVPAQRPYEADYEYPLEGEPACNGDCGYVYTYDNDEGDSFWILSNVLQCPLDTTACEGLADALAANPARCNTAADCTNYSGTLARCEPFYDQPHYIDSTLFTAEERAARESILLQMQQHGCRHAFLGWDGPINEIGCVDNLCGIVDGESECSGAPIEPECDACSASVDAGLDE